MVSSPITNLLIHVYIPNIMYLLKFKKDGKLSLITLLTELWANLPITDSWVGAVHDSNITTYEMA